MSKEAGARRLTEEAEAGRVNEDTARWLEGEVTKLGEAAAKKFMEAKRREAEMRPRLVRAKLAEVASPAPNLAPDGRLDAGPNKVFDAPTGDVDLPALPIQQHTVIKTILSDLPSNAPKHLRSSLESYDDELRARGVQPILGVLKNMAEIIEAAIGSPNAQREWLEDGMCAAFKVFSDNHALFVKHFPLDLEREELYARTPVDEGNAIGSKLLRPFAEVAIATVDANKAKLTTDEFLKVVNGLADFAKVISTMPPSLPSSAPTTRPRDGVVGRKSDVALPNVAHRDGLIPPAPPVSARKRMILSGLGFLERTYNLLGTTVTLMGTPEGIALLAVLHSAIEALSKLLLGS
jgi:hypothetical protein